MFIVLQSNQNIDYMQRYANITLDETSKVVLFDPSNKELFMGMIELLVHKRLKDLIFLNTEQHGLAISDKNSTFDMLCQSADTGEEFIVEVQNRSQASYMDRMLSYATFPLRRQMAEKRERLLKQAETWDRQLARREKAAPLERMDYALKPVYVISILNFALEHEDCGALEEGLVSRYSIREDTSGELMTDALHFIFLELGRLKADFGEDAKCRTRLERFAYTWRYMHLLEAVPEGFEDPLVLKLMQASEYANLPIEKQRQYDKTMTTELDIIAQNNWAIDQAKRQSREEGRQEGRINTAKNLIALGVDLDIVSKATGIPVEELEKLR